MTDLMTSGIWIVFNQHLTDNQVYKHAIYLL